MRLGLVGYGTGGRHFHAPFIAAARGVDLTGIVARAPSTVANAKADGPDVPVFASLTAMFDAGVDAVTITTPPDTRTGGPPPVTAADAIAVLTALDAARTSPVERREVRL